jgi:hypothetical protein
MLKNPVLSGASALIEKLPQHIVLWQRATSQIIQESKLFEYMDGSGELYLAYRFDHAQVTEYIPAVESLPPISVQVYKMQSDHDAFGLLSLDWDGEPMNIADVIPGITPNTIPSHHALYGAGLLRAWAGQFYFRIMTYQESALAKAQICSLARILMKGLVISDYPDLLNTLPLKVGAFYLLKYRVHFFRSYLVLNSLYYLAQENILHFDRDCQAVLAFYRSESSETVPLLIIQYPQSNRAHGALASFLQTWFPDQPKASENQNFFTKTFEGWTGCTQDADRCYITFEHSHPDSVQPFLQHLRRRHV